MRTQVVQTHPTADGRYWLFYCKVCGKRHYVEPTKKPNVIAVANLMCHNWIVPFHLLPPRVEKRRYRVNRVKRSRS